jgi:chitinase
MPARSASRTRTQKTIGLVAAAALVAAGLATAVTAGTAHAATAPLTANWYESAPYYYTLDSAAPDPGQVMSDTGEKAFLLAFILADGGCTPAWDGTDPVSSDTQVAAVISEVRADGGDVGASEGGANGTKLGQDCSTPAATAAAYQSVITTYNLHYFDFDLEEPEIESSSAVANEIGAAQILQAEDPGLIVSITIPTTTTGVNYFGQLALDQALSDGYVPDDWSLMPFDNGFSGGAAAQQTALTDFHSELESTFGWSSAVAWNHEGISQMNGQSDTGEIFEPADFASNLAFAEANNLSRFTLSTPPSSGSLVNGDFSTGSLSPWVCDSGTAQIATSPTYDSSYALEATPTSSDDAQCEQTITVAADTTYTLSGYLDGNYVYLGVSGAASTDTWTESTSGYQELSVSFTTGSSTSLTVYVHGWYDEGTYYADDLSLT